ncbi:16S rRNA (guanine(966)-N(2))-methyltransferase RsmD [Zhongshania sp. BJYM1]|jgi:16S rRNA (guanine966-N2)-methyltransferase|uniref:16S rRNA (guanine(966)-N(2))-methyltransferase RsmD n=1 Tax=Zhongshania aquatica TaxID=2965069 RepID=UPI0022B38CD5|nr:16S rRNA (guanine(966)-N(2))-methyltransferase RsmD [Marortus sp. BJYM1]
MRKPQGHHNKEPQGILRIIGGQWRSRKLHFQAAEGLRPTSDRIRETLFNWLSPTIHGAHCLDLFAGSGALGLEALSRYADHCDFVETDANTCRDIREHLNILQCSSGLVHCQSAETYLANRTIAHDIIFLDPPFHKALLAPVIAALASKHLKFGTLIYIETATDEPLPSLPTNWHIEKEKKAGQVNYRLISVSS